MKGERVRVSGQLGRAARGPIITTADGSVWALEAADVQHGSFGEQVTVEGVVIGLDKLKVDWVGVAQREGEARSKSSVRKSSNTKDLR